MQTIPVLHSQLSKRVLQAYLVFEKSNQLQGWPLAPGMAKNVTDIAREDGFKAELGECMLVRPEGGRPLQRVIVIGGENASEANLNTLRQFAATAVRKAQKLQVHEIAVVLPSLENLSPFDESQAVAEGIILGSYRFDKLKSSQKDKPNILNKVWVAANAKDFMTAREGVKRGIVFAECTNFARDLVNEPPSDLTPEALAKAAIGISGDRIRTRIFRLKDLERMKMNALLGVSRGSDKAPPVFIHLHYKPPHKPIRRVAVCGKGVTFDSGGLCIKPGNAMDTMKMDMAGAAAVLGLFKGLKSIKPPVEVHGCIPATENMPGDNAYKPGDVVRASNGKTIEILNTDAEGRVILADALSYASVLPVSEIIDLATLTGACIVALGSEISGLMGNDDALKQKITQASEKSGEKVWPLPLPKEYKKHIKSKIADVKNIGSKGEAGAIAGGMFLQEFVEHKAWVHLDIAGPAWTKQDSPLCPEGGTGVMVRTLLHDFSSEVPEITQKKSSKKKKKK